MNQNSKNNPIQQFISSNKEKKVHGVTYKEELVDQNILVSVRHLKRFFPRGGGKKLKAVHDVSFDIKKGECFGLVGESGCGKTTTGRSIIRLYQPTSGSIYFKGYRVAAGDRWNQKEIKWSKIKGDAKIKEIRQKEKSELSERNNNTLEEQIQYNAVKDNYEKEVQKIKEHVAEIKREQVQKIKRIHYDNRHVDPKLRSKRQRIFQDPIDSLDPRRTVEDIIQEGLKIQGYRNRQENH